MSKSSTTIYDIAAKLKVTPSTVSRALSDHPRISSKTKQAVKSIAQQMNYQHNGIAAALRSGQTHIIGVLLPMVNRSFFSSVVKGIEQVARVAGYNVMITQSNDKEENERSIISAMLKTQVDGVIASIARETTNFSHYQNILDKKIPLILFDRVTEITDASTVVIDDYLGAYKATEHLIHQGCKRIAHFSGTQNLNIYKDRERGYREALKNNGIVFEEDLLIQSNVKLEDGRTGMERLLLLDQPPDAIFAASDYSAIGAMQILKERKMKIPDDVALVGFADEAFANFVDPELSSVNQMSEQMGQFAAKIFLEQTKDRELSFIPSRTVLTPKLMIRKSSLKKSI
ncbi:MAG: LacI family DNA-binding transcriptional regulator [Bacteroidota bacterium]